MVSRKEGVLLGPAHLQGPYWTAGLARHCPRLWACAESVGTRVNQRQDTEPSHVWPHGAPVFQALVFLIL